MTRSWSWSTVECSGIDQILMHGRFPFLRGEQKRMKQLPQPTSINTARFRIWHLSVANQTTEDAMQVLFKAQQRLDEKEKQVEAMADFFKRNPMQKGSCDDGRAMWSMCEWSGLWLDAFGRHGTKIDAGAGLQEEVRKSDEGFEGVDKRSKAKVP